MPRNRLSIFDWTELPAGIRIICGVLVGLPLVLIVKALVLFVAGLFYAGGL
jgi:hypothetical protein